MSALFWLTPPFFKSFLGDFQLDLPGFENLEGLNKKEPPTIGGSSYLVFLTTLLE
jgi:hypothetical protein